MVEPLVENVVDPPIVTEIAQPAEPVEQIHVRRPVRQNQPVTPNDFVAYLSEHAYDVGIVIDPKSYIEAITFSQSSTWVDEMESMINNDF